MINFTKHIGPGGIPIYHQRLPGTKSVSIRWVMFVGGADDITIGAPGLFHWFEHVPFRGTKRFPGGARDRYEMVRHGGLIGANTTTERTQYHAKAPLGRWKEFFWYVTDLMCQPLLRDQDIEAEKEIIRQEISDSLSSSDRMMWRKVKPIIWGGHPFQHEVLGSEESLNSMDASTLRKGHELYSRSRCVLVVAGDIAAEEVLSALDEVIDLIPDRQLSERHGPVSYGKVPKLESGITEFDGPLHGSKIALVFQMPGFHTEQDVDKLLPWRKLGIMCTAGSTYSPLMRTVREDRQLVYETGRVMLQHLDGGYWGFVASAKPGNTEKILDAFQDVLRIPELRDGHSRQYADDNLRGTSAMSEVDPCEYTEDVCGDLLSMGHIISEEGWLNKITSVPQSDIDELLSELTPENARTFIFKGKGS